MKLTVFKYPECGATYTMHIERYINDADVIEAKSRAKNRKCNLILNIIIPLVAILLFVGIFGAVKHSSNVEEDKLQAIVDEVMIDIENGDFDEAYIKPISKQSLFSTLLIGPAR